MDTSLVLLSGGWESAACLILAKKQNPNCVGLFVDYGQPYLEQEKKAVVAISKITGVEVFREKMESMCAAQGVFDNRNEKFIESAVAHKPSIVYLGCRAPLDVFDRYKDSNWQFAKRMEKKHGVKIKTPLIMWPKCMIKFYVTQNGISPEVIFSSEGFNYDIGQ